MSILIWIVVGLIAGVLAKAIMPGSRDEPGGWLGTIALGIVGAVIGGFLSSLVLGGGGANGLNLGSILVSVVGACVLIGILRMIRR
ncbi:GlsB/YeaQ/YmgE family stress response membrane protein [Armatimonas rosea]|uniref:Putative membrane protein YeaQ/YmgE (Transglycosylase-associated protein family) n=1 Tax=Armatimonas rosea TaxID=685828 RepID=A0A7W9SW86_ARMRO|nr:GlsB/YeaQ/YmgE family stress response membrane protein [Armatimonas rosea]MBB6053515.1 putative membrane protein YeaQ/YmgE (transglycosylase-associated protein family) [Armatimonas rosea]